MSIRRHLKATLGLLAVGSVAFAGAAHADNSVVDVQQNASGKAQFVKQKDGTEQFEIGGDSNVLLVKQTGKDVTLEGSMTGGNNNVGNIANGSKEYLKMTAKDSSNDYDIDFKLNQDGSDAINVTSVNLTSQDGSGSKKGEIDAAGNINLTVTQNAGANTINVGYVKSAAAMTGNVTQQDGATLNLKYVETTSGNMDFTVNQSGGASNRITLGDDIAPVKAGSLEAKITQQTGDSNAVNLYDFNVGGKLTIKGYSDDTLTQDGGSNTVLMHDVDSAADTEIAIDQSNNSNQIHVDKIDASAGAITFKVNQENGGNVVDVANLTSDSADVSADINQTGGGDSFKVDTQVKANDDVTISATQSGSSDSVELDTVTSNSGKAQLTFTQSGSSDTVSMDTVTAEKDVTMNITQSAASDKVDIKTVTSSDDAVDITVDQSSSNSEFIIADEVSAKNKVTIDVTQENGDSNKLKVNDVKSTNGAVDFEVVMSGSNNSMGGIDVGSDANGLAANYDAGLVQEAGDNATLKAHIYGDQNTVALKQVAGTTADFYLDIGSSGSTVNNNEVDVYQNASTSAYADIDITGSNNTLKLYQTSSGANVYADIDITSSGNTIAITQKAGAEGASYVKVY